MKALIGALVLFAAAAWLVSPEAVTQPAFLVALGIVWLLFSTQPRLPAARHLWSDAPDGRSALMILASVAVAIAAMSVELALTRAAVSWAALSTGAILCAAGIALRVWAMRVLGAHFHAVVALGEGQVVVARGPYRVLRHPSYAGVLVVLLGLAIITGSAAGTVASVLLVVPAYLHRIAQEEELLIRERGGDYEELRVRTWRLVPWLY